MVAKIELCLNCKHLETYTNGGTTNYFCLIKYREYLKGPFSSTIAFKFDGKYYDRDRIKIPDTCPFKLEHVVEQGLEKC